MPYITNYDSPIGSILLLSNGDALTGLLLPTQVEKSFDPMAYLQKDDLHVFTLTKEYLDAYFKGEIPKSIPPLAFSASSFKELVWFELLKIPYGETITYGELAKRVALVRGTSFMSARAVGHAVGKNPISIIVPCHRVIGHKKSLVGYGGGLPLKRELLAIEGHDIKKYKD